MNLSKHLLTTQSLDFLGFTWKTMSEDLPTIRQNIYPTGSYFCPVPSIPLVPQVCPNDHRLIALCSFCNPSKLLTFEKNSACKLSPSAPFSSSSDSHSPSSSPWAPLHPPLSRLFLSTDASDLGWGRSCRIRTSKENGAHTNSISILTKRSCLLCGRRYLQGVIFYSTRH